MGNSNLVQPSYFQTKMEFEVSEAFKHLSAILENVTIKGFIDENDKY